jgi:hypothetical protein
MSCREREQMSDMHHLCGLQFSSPSMNDITFFLINDGIEGHVSKGKFLQELG